MQSEINESHNRVMKNRTPSGKRPNQDEGFSSETNKPTEKSSKKMASDKKRHSILIAGGLGFIGSCIVDRCFKEGHEVFIIDDLSTGSKKNVRGKHKLYQLDIRDAACEEVFKNQRFDILIHAAACEDPSINLPGREVSMHIQGMENLLSLSANYGVKRVIYISSADVYGHFSTAPLKEEDGEMPDSTYGVDRLTTELYCQKLSDIFSLDTLILRPANVYGPRRRPYGSGGGLINRAISLGKIDVINDDNFGVDYLYVEDLADAVYKAIDCRTSPVLNLSSGEETRQANLIELLQKEIPGIEMVPCENGTIYTAQPTLNNSRAKKELNWFPQFSLRGGLVKTRDWYRKNPVDADHEAAAAVETPIKKRNVSKYLPYLENGLACSLTALFMQVTKNNADYQMLDIRLLYILLMGIMYGMTQSMIAVVLSVIMFFFFSMEIGKSFLSLINDPISLSQLLLYILIGLYTGYATDKKNQEIASGNVKIKDMEKKIEFITDLNHEANSVRDKLQNQIMSFEDSYGKIFTITRKIDSLEPENIFNASVELLENVMKSNGVAIYVLNKSGDYLRMIAHSKLLNAAKSMSIQDLPEIKELAASREIFINKSLKKELPMLIAPIFLGDKMISVVAVYDMRFENLTLHYQNMFKVVTGLISSSLLKAYQYEEATYEKRCIGGTPILNRESFKRILQLKTEAKTKYTINYVVIRVDDFDIENEDLLEKLLNSVRSVDYIGYLDHGLSVLLTNIDQNDARIFTERLKMLDISARMITDVGEYV